MPYPTKALTEYMLRSEFEDLVANGVAGPPGPQGPAGPTGATGATGPAGAPGAPWTPVESATAPATTTSGTITTAALTVSRVAPAAAITGVILAVGTIGGQQICVLNQSAFSITFGTAGTSHVS